LAGNVYRAGAPVEREAEPAFKAEPITAAETAMATPEEAAPKRRWLPKGFIRARTVADPTKTEPVAAQPVSASAESPREVTIDDLAAALREAGEGGKRVAVISAAAGNGATRSAVALARALAKNARVVMVDLALEHPELASITLDPRAPGIADLVHGSASVGQIITRDRISRVQVVPAGRVGGEAGMIFMSERLSMAMDALSRAYDHIVIDAGASPYVPADRIAKLASCGVLVAGDATAEAVNTMRDHLANAGFSDIAVFTGTAPALDAESVGSVAA
jgi:Mrp family chromosome partitioning ATPase